MTFGQANKVLERPIFGDEQCITARDIIELGIEVEQARQNVKAKGDLATKHYPQIANMDEEQLREELKNWKEMQTHERTWQLEM